MILRLTLSLVVFLSLIAPTINADPLRVVTTLSTYADITKSIGGELVEVTFIASPKFNPHFIEPRPSDILKVKRANLFIHSGLDLEAWRDPLLEAAARSDLMVDGKNQLDLSVGISLLEVPTAALSRAQGDIHHFGNPHFWVNPQNGKIISASIAAKLSELDPDNSKVYSTAANDLNLKIDQKIASWKEGLAKLHGSEFVAYHNEWIYLADFAGFSIKHFLEPKPGIPPTPRQLEFLTSYIRDQSIRGIIQATFYPDEAAKQLAAKTGAKVVYLCQNVGEIEQVNDYISMLEYNLASLTRALER